MRKERWRDLALVALGSIAGALGVWWFVGRDAPPVSVAPAESEPAIGDVVSESDVVAEDTTAPRPRTLMERHSAWRGDWKPKENAVEPAVAKAQVVEEAAEAAARKQPRETERSAASADADPLIAVVLPSVVIETLWEGPLPKQNERVLPPTAARHCQASAVWDAEDIIPLDFEIAGDRLAGVLVYVEHPRFEGLWADVEPAALTIEGCRFVPHVFAYEPGQKLKVTNRDPLLHTLHASHGRQSLVSQAMPKPGTTINVRLRAPLHSIIEFDDNAYPFMSAFAVVLDHPYHAVTDARGYVAIARRLLPGNYTVVAVHPKLPAQREQIRVDAGRGAHVRFKFQAPADEKLSAR